MEPGPTVHEFLLCTQQSHHFLQHGWYTHMKVDVTQCRGFLGKGLRNFLHRHRLCLPFVSTHRGNGRRETLRVGNKTVFSFPLSCLLLGPSLVKEKKNTTTKPSCTCFFYKMFSCTRSPLGSTELQKIRCTLSLRKPALCPAVDLPEGETST